MLTTWYEFLKIFDSHFHIIDKRFPLVANNNYLPEEFTVNNYLQSTKTLNITAGAIVSGSFQAFDQTYLLAALKRLGKNFVGVAQLPTSCSDEEILSLNHAGVRAIRFNLKRGGSEDIQHIENMAYRVNDLANWHVELYVDAAELDDLYSTLIRLPRLSIDHLGLSYAGFPNLLKLVEKGARVKATGFGRVDFDVSTAMQKIVDINPDALMFGTDMPSTRAPRPFQTSDMHNIYDLFDSSLCHKILYENAYQWYQPSTV